MEAPDEASHEGRADEKVKALENIDKHIVGKNLLAQLVDLLAVDQVRVAKHQILYLKAV